MKLRLLGGAVGYSVNKMEHEIRGATLGFEPPWKLPSTGDPRQDALNLEIKLVGNLSEYYIDRWYLRMFHGVEPSDEMGKPSVNNLALAGLVGMKRFAKVSRTVLELRIEQGFSDEQFSAGVVVVAMASIGIGTAAASRLPENRGPLDSQPTFDGPYLETSERPAQASLKATESGYITAVQAAGSCLHDALARSPQIESFSVSLPSGVSRDGFSASYSVIFTTPKHGKGEVLGPEDLDFVAKADADCRTRHLESIEADYRSKVVDKRGAKAVEDLMACLGVRPRLNKQDNALLGAREALSQVDASTNKALSCAKANQLALAALAEGK